jgi:DNA gyrase/topoisomerase IV subunit A
MMDEEQNKQSSGEVSVAFAQGAEGIAVGLSTKVLPHNFNELIDSSIKY